MSLRRWRKDRHEDSFKLGTGILGWIETHEQADNVAMRLQRISLIGGT